MPASNSNPIIFISYIAVYEPAEWSLKDSKEPLMKDKEVHLAKAYYPSNRVYLHDTAIPQEYIPIPAYVNRKDRDGKKKRARIYICRYKTCMGRSTSRSSVLSHTRRHLGVCLMCPVCNYRCFHSEGLDRHFTSDHSHLADSAFWKPQGSALGVPVTPDVHVPPSATPLVSSVEDFAPDEEIV